MPNVCVWPGRSCNTLALTRFAFHSCTAFRPTPGRSHSSPASALSRSAELSFYFSSPVCLLRVHFARSLARSFAAAAHKAAAHTHSRIHLPTSGSPRLAFLLPPFCSVRSVRSLVSLWLLRLHALLRAHTHPGCTPWIAPRVLRKMIQLRNGAELKRI